MNILGISVKKANSPNNSPYFKIIIIQFNYNKIFIIIFIYKMICTFKILIDIFVDSLLIVLWKSINFSTSPEYKKYKLKSSMSPFFII